MPTFDLKSPQTRQDSPPTPAKDDAKPSVGRRNKTLDLTIDRGCDRSKLKFLVTAREKHQWTR